MTPGRLSRPGGSTTVGRKLAYREISPALARLEGSLSPGKLADFVVPDRDILEVPEADLAEARYRGPCPPRYHVGESGLASGAMSDNSLRAGLIPLHLMYHAVKEEIYGQGMIDELRRHGYKIGPGTLYPMLHRLEERGYLRVREARSGRIMRRYYRATPSGRAALAAVLPQVRELFEELIEHREPARRRK